MAIRDELDAKKHHQRTQEYNALWNDITPEFARKYQSDFLKIQKTRDYIYSNAPNTNLFRVALKAAKTSLPLENELMAKIMDLIIADLEIESAYWTSLGW